MLVLVASKNGIESVLSNDHPRRNISGDQSRKYEKPDAKERLIGGRNENSVAKWKVDGVRSKKWDQKSVYEREPDH